jgi:alpha-galactosidase
LCYVQLDEPRTDQAQAMRIPGLDPARRYLATEVTPGEPLLERTGLAGGQAPGVQASGAALAEIGLSIPPQRPLTAAIILLRAC